MQRNNKPGRIVKGTAKTPTLKEASGVWTLDEAMQAHRANAWPQPNLLQPISKSLRLKWLSAGGAGLYRYGVHGGDQRKFTFSGWVKRGLRTGVDDSEMISANWGTSYYAMHIAFSQGNDGIQLYDWGPAGSGTFSIQTVPVFKDTNAWYHVVVAVDTTQTIAFNRAKIWVNGVQILDFTNQNNWNTADGGFPSLNYATPFNKPNGLISVGASASADTMLSTKIFDGDLAEFYLVDGAATVPTLFGTLGPAGTWIPVPYTGTYGSNGFYLPFNNTTNSQTLGYDASNTGSTVVDINQDPYRSSVALHLTGNGSVGGQNNTFIDSSVNNIVVTRSGSATQGSFSPFIYDASTSYNPAVHGASAHFGTTTSDNIYAANNTAFAIGTNNFTLEFWANWTAWTGEQRMILMGQSGSSPFEIGRGADANSLKIYTNTDLKINYAWSPTVGAWHHIAVVRTGTGPGQLILYINGVNVATGTSADSISANNFFVGGLNWATGFNMQGYISNVRLTGSAIYTAAFTPTMRPFGTLTSNLLTFSDYLLDSSSTLSGATAILAPALDNSFTGIKLIEAATTGARYILQNSTVTLGTTYVHSVYVKAEERKFFQMAASIGFQNSNDFWVNYDLTNGTYSIQGENALNGTASITSMGNGWFRCAISSIAQDSTSTGRYTMSIAYSLTDTRLFQAAGDGVSGLFLCWPQLEVGTTATTYTPTPANFRTAPSLLLKFENAAIVDSTGANNVITLSGATIANAGKYGAGALSFNGSTDRLDISGPQVSGAAGPAGGNPNLIPGTKDFTVEMWLNTRTGNDGYHRIISSSNGGFTSGTFCMRHQPGSFLFGPNGNVQYGTITYSVDFALNTWTHVAYSRQGATGRGFINGREVVTCGDTTNYYEAIQFIGSWYQGSPSEYFNGSLDDVRITIGVARYTTDFTPPSRALPETGGKSFVTRNVNAGVVRTFTTNNLNIVGAKIYHVTTAPRSSGYSVEYSDNNIDWTTAFSGVMSSMDSTVGIKVGTVTTGGSGTTGTGVWGTHLYWRYVEGATISGHHPRCSRIILTDITGADYNFRIFANDNSADQGEYQIGTKSSPLQGPTRVTSWTAPIDVTQVEVLVVGGGGSGGANNGAGGGAGGLIYNNAYPVTPGVTYTVQVGTGGAAQFGSGGWSGAVGSNSKFGSLTAIGGGGGAGGNVAGTYAGGSGGGACRSVGPGAGTAGQGFPGGTNRVSPEGGGGGGAGMFGFAGDGATYGGKGGNGLQFGIVGTPTYYAGGGGGGAEGTVGAPRAGAGGLGGGGAGGAIGGAVAAPGWSGYIFNSGAYTNYGQDATPNTGGGGGAEASGSVVGAVGFGGTGIVILRYTTATESSSHTEDSLLDSPTNYGHDMQLGGEVVGNYCTLNPLTNTKVGNIGTLTEGNLNFSGIINQRSYVNGTMYVSSGKWYFEVNMGSWGNQGDTKYIGITRVDVNAATNATFVTLASGYHRGFTNAFDNDLSFNDGAGTQTNQLAAAKFWNTDGAIYGLAIDIDNNTMSLYKNGVLAYTKTSAGLSGYSWTAFQELESSSSRTPATNIRYNFGQRPWIYTPPAGYNAWNTKNLPRLTNAAATPNQYFDTVTYNGDGTYPKTITGLNFRPGLVWIKDRYSTAYPRIYDSIRGSTELYPNVNNAEAAGSMSSYNADGFTLSADLYGSGINVPNNNHVAWAWRASDTAVPNTSGTITSSVRANALGGFSIVAYSGNGAASATIGHGLGATPAMVITKVRNGTDDWRVWHQGLFQGVDATGHFIKLNATDASSYDSQRCTGGDSTTFRVIGNASPYINATGSDYIAYVWAEVPGYSKFGTYVANGSVNGPFINCGFKPRFIMIKATSSTSQWVMIDTARDVYNGASSSSLFANSTAAEEMGNTAEAFDIVSNGFKVRSNGRVNVTGVTHIYMAFAERPYKDALAATSAATTRAPVVTEFGYTGADQSYVVPAGVKRIKVAAWGAGGSAGTPTTGGALTGPGGGAGSVEGYIAVTPGETLTIKVGQGIDALAGIVGNGTQTNTVLSSSIYGDGGVNGKGDGSGSNAGSAGAGGGASSIVRASTMVLAAAGGGGAAGAGYTGSNPSAGGGAGGAGTGAGGTGRGSVGTFTSGQGTYAGEPGAAGGGGGGGGGSGSTANLGNGDPGQGGTNTVPAGCTSYSGSGRTAANITSPYYNGVAGYGGIAPVAGGSIITPDGRVVIIA